MVQTVQLSRRRTPPGVRELKPRGRGEEVSFLGGRTPPGVRELKRSSAISSYLGRGRTPPGVRELKLNVSLHHLNLNSRTPPGVRELKRGAKQLYRENSESHPSRGA